MQVWDDRWACLAPLFRLRRRVGRGGRPWLVCRFKRGALEFRETCALAPFCLLPTCVLRLPIDDPHYVCASGRSRDCCGNWPKTYATGADWISEKPSSALSSVRRLRGTGVGLTKCGKVGKTQEWREVRSGVRAWNITRQFAYLHNYRQVAIRLEAPNEKVRGHDSTCVRVDHTETFARRLPVNRGCCLDGG